MRHANQMYWNSLKKLVGLANVGGSPSQYICDVSASVSTIPPYSPVQVSRSFVQERKVKDSPAMQ